MIDDSETLTPVKRANPVQWGLVAAMLVLLIATQLFSHRPRFLTNRPTVVHVADLRADKTEDLRSQFYGDVVTIPDTVYLPPIGLKAAPAYGSDESPPMIGYSIREVSALGMPFAAYPGLGAVLYVSDGVSFRMIPLDDEMRGRIQDIAGPIGDYAFPWWDYVWGWALIVLLACWGWLWWRSKVRERAETGLI